jgi:two-component system NtrC family sensor kinase
MSLPTGCLLVITTDLAVSHLCQQALQQTGYAIAIAHSLHALSDDDDTSDRPALILLDLDTTIRTNTVSHLRRLHADMPAAPIIVLADTSADAAPSLLEGIATAMQAGARRLLFKPLDEDELRHAVARVLAENPQHTRREGALLRWSELLHRTAGPALTPERLYELAVDWMRCELEADWVSLLEWEPEHETLRVAGCAHLPGASRLFQVGQSVPLTDTFAGWVVRHQQPLHANSADDVPPELRHLLANMPPISTISWPVFAEGTLLGVVNVGRANSTTPFDAADRDMLALLVDHIATWVPQARINARLDFLQASQRTLLAYAGDAVWLLDADGQRILDANPMAEHLSGYSRRELLEAEPRVLLPGLYAAEAEHTTPDYRDIPDTPGALLAADNGITPEPFICSRDGRSIPVVLHVSHITHQGAPFLLVIARDYSNTPLPPRHLIQREKLAATRRLLSNMAHEINNPLQAIQNTLHLLNNRSANGNAEKHQRYLQMATEEVDHLAHIVQRMLHMHHIANESKRPLHMHDILRAAMHKQSERLHAAGIYIDWNLAPFLPNIFGASSQLTQVCESLIANAIDAMPAGGVLSIRTYTTSQMGISTGAHLARLAPETDETDTVVVEVQDTGTGISPEALERIFEPFFSTRDRLGMSLATSYSIVEQCNGKMTVSSEIGHGTMFQLRLPAITATDLSA